ncbi:hypothetical protein EV672_107175 [Aquabacterium commune]|uniref:TonB family protein n=1 Tax=Aquabacterium commune TaxID=70586 RepID=A0A4R6R7D5_9BURK|nr:hypothetical protein EV672_107175 [Aquabacterium commune]
MHGTAPLLTPPGPLGPPGGSRRSRRSGRVGWCVLAALGLHAALGLGLFLRTQALVPGHSAAVSGGHAHTAMHVRWALSAPTRVSAVSAEQPMSDAAAPADTSEAITAEAITASEPAGPAVETPVSDAAASSQAPTSADSAATFTGYARRDMLDRPPQALGIVQIGYPAGVEPGRVRTGRLTLFIDEAGAVRKVMVATPQNAEDALPAPFVEAAREAFLQARFAPGERQGMPVKSRIDVEVSFDGRETEPVDTAQQPNAPAGTDRAV